MNHNVSRLLLRAAAAHGAAPAVVERERTSSYAELAVRAGAFAATMRASGIAPGATAAVLLERGIDAAAAIYGIHAAGGVAVVLNGRLRPRQLTHVLDDAAVQTLVSTAGDLDRATLDPAGRWPVIDATAVALSAPLECAPREATDLAQIIYTAGSTGLPKGVMHTHGSISAGVAAVTGYLGLRSDDRVGSLLALSSVYGLNQLLCSVAAGAALVVIPSPFAADIVAELRQLNVTVAAGVPPLWLQLLGVPDFQTPLPALRQIQNAGGHLPTEAARRLRAAQPQASVILQYGMTETWRSTFLPPEEADRRPGSMGRAMPGAELLIVGEDGAPVAIGVTGQLVHSGPTIAAGYWRAEATSAIVFRPHPTRETERAVYSGDFVRADADGYYYFVGRRDQIIKTMGHRVGPDEIVEVLHASGEVAEAVVAGEEDPERGQRIVAWVVIRAEGSLVRLRRYCRSELPPYMQPSRITVRSELPRLPSGKYALEELRRDAT